MRVKNEILVQMDGVSNADANERLLLVGATNRPQELDEAARRRLQKRLLIPLPDSDARCEISIQLPSGSRTKEMRAVLPIVTGARPSAPPRARMPACSASVFSTWMVM